MYEDKPEWRDFEFRRVSADADSGVVGYVFADDEIPSE
jgi:hypothetical protein